MLFPLRILVPSICDRFFFDDYHQVRIYIRPFSCLNITSTLHVYAEERREYIYYYISRATAASLFESKVNRRHFDFRRGRRA